MSVKEKIPALEIEQLHVSYGSIKALTGVNLQVPVGEICGLIGMNGCGKSTLYKTIMGMEQPSAGKIRIFGEESLTARKNGWVGYVPQNELIDLYFPISVAEVVMMGRYGFMGSTRRPRAADYVAVKAALKRVNLTEYEHRAIGDLSGGQRKRVFVARALAQGAKLLLLDEPFAGVDKDSEAMISRLLKELSDEGATIIISTHDLAAVPLLCEKVALLNRKIHYYGDPHQALTPEYLAPAFTEINPEGPDMETSHTVIGEEK